MGLNIDFINVETLLTLGIISLALGITFLIISIVINKKLSKNQPKPKNPKITTNEIKKQDLPSIEAQKPQEEINVIKGNEIPKIVIDRNNQKQNTKENIQPIEITLEKQEPIKITTDIIEIDQPQEKEDQEEIPTKPEELEEITLKELEEQLPAPQEEPKEQPDFIELDQSQKEITKTEPTIIKPKEITIATTKPTKGKEQKINLEESEEEIELL